MRDKEEDETVVKRSMRKNKGRWWMPPVKVKRKVLVIKKNYRDMKVECIHEIN